MPLTVTIQGQEFYDWKKKEFKNTEPKTLVLEHSLISISKWESIWHVPYLETENKTDEQVLSYIQCMCIKGDASMETLQTMTVQNIQEISDYIQDPMTATTIKDDMSAKGKKQFITSELIYSWMVGYQIPVKFEQWHLNRLLTLIRVLNEQNKPKKKMSQAEIAKRNAAINEANRRKFHTKG